MLLKSLRVHLAALLLLVPIAAAAEEKLWSLYQPACLANGIDPNPCLCILDEVVRVHGDAENDYQSRFSRLTRCGPIDTAMLPE